MNELMLARTRRHLFRMGAATAVAAAASIPLIAAVRNSAQAGPDSNRGNDCNNKGACCFLKGTKIRTSSGERSVEELQIGDTVRVLDGRQAAIKWIGFSRFRKTEGRKWPKRVMPIRVARYALDELTPRNDLYLSPDHSLYIGGVFIPIKLLVNGASIAAAVPGDATAIEYYNIELETHEVIYAEGATTESLLVYDNSVRERFSNFVEYERLYGIEHGLPMVPVAPFVRYFGAADEVKGLVRLIVSSVVDIRDPIQTAFDRIAERARALAPAS